MDSENAVLTLWSHGLAGLLYTVFPVVLVARGYLRVDMEDYGAVKLEEKSRALLRGEEHIDLRREEKQKAATRRKSSPAATGVAGEDQALWEALRECRRALAAEQGVPPYVIFHDATLREMCAARPLDLDAFGLISGVGVRKRDKYAEAFLRVIRDHS